ncbi:CHAT domain-containing protein [Bernardetia sp. OM2101]|uniref:CHAT domain-containing tetratricopeptide repeat protein n=1 Tax=Bernardetia sp. OM2101 TaxID=3344876 RepID=UPI0035CF2967
MKFTLLLVLLFFAFNFSAFTQNLEKLSYQELDSIGLDLLRNEDYKKSEKYFQTALSKIELEFGKEDTLYAQTTIHLAYVYMEDLRYQEAKPLLIEARELTQKAVGKNHKHYAHSCYFLANFYLENAVYTKTEPLFLEAKTIYEKLGEKDNEFYLRVLRGLADIYYEQSLYDKAEPIYLELQAIIEKELGKNHLWYGIICEDLANLYSDIGKNDKAEKLYFQAMEIYEKEEGQESEGYSSICNNLGNLYSDIEMYEKAETYYNKAIQIDMKIFGKNSPLLADDINNIAELYILQGNYKKAKKFHKKALSTYQNIFGEDHPDYALSCFNLASLYKIQQRYQTAENYYEEALRNKKKQINRLFPTLSEEEKTLYYNDILMFFEGFIDYAITYHPQKKQMSARLFDELLFMKGIIFSSTQKMKKQILGSNDTTLISQYKNWKRQKQNYISLLQTPIEERDKAIDITKLNSDINELEREISKKSASFKENTTKKDYTWQQVRESLSEKEAVIEMFHLIKYNKKGNEIDTVYIALILTKETKENPELLVLKNGQELENEALFFYQNNIDFQLENNESYNQYWKPIQDKLDSLSNKKGYSKIYFSPDGVYHKLNLNTFKNPITEKYLLEEQSIQLITSSRDLIQLKNQEDKNLDLSKNFAEYKAYLLGYPSYNLNGKDTLKVNGIDRSLNGLQRVVGQQTVIPVLEGTKIETNRINNLLNQKHVSTILLQNNEATEENIKALKNPTILHIATHGFFINEIPSSKVTTMQEAEDRSLLENPFLRSGLLLAGCQNPQLGEEDGILSAEEAMNLNLDGTELVILSACETGLGDVHNGEGVYGLQRAFRQAGAKTLIMSLWKVSDEATQLLMVTFYESLLSGKSKREAFKIAQLKLKEKYNEPYYWGAFVMVGE